MHCFLFLYKSAAVYYRAVYAGILKNMHYMGLNMKTLKAILQKKKIFVEGFWIVGEYWIKGVKFTVLAASGSSTLLFIYYYLWLSFYRWHFYVPWVLRNSANCYLRTSTTTGWLTCTFKVLVGFPPNYFGYVMELFVVSVLVPTL